MKKEMQTKKQLCEDLGISAQTLRRYLSMLKIKTSGHLLNPKEVFEIKKKLGFDN